MNDKKEKIRKFLKTDEVINELADILYDDNEVGIRIKKEKNSDNIRLEVFEKELNMKYKVSIS